MPGGCTTPEDLDDAMTKRQLLAEEQSAHLLELLKQNTQLTELTGKWPSVSKRSQLAKREFTDSHNLLLAVRRVGRWVVIAVIR
jgi:hypothetical protein